jgi:hypothetical protein
MARPSKGRKPKAPPSTHPVDNVGATELDRPVFGQPAPTPDPTQFEVKHPSDDPIYKQIDALNRAHKLAPLPFLAPRGLPEPRLSLADVLNIPQADLDNQIKTNKQLVFHSTGDTGNTRGPTDQNLVADKLISDFSDYDVSRNHLAAKVRKFIDFIVDSLGKETGTAARSNPSAMPHAVVTLATTASD